MSKSFAKKTIKITLYSLIAYMIALIALLALAPMILSVASVHNYAIATFIQPHLKPELHIKTLSLSWFGSQKVSGITLLDPQQAVLASVDSIEINNSLIHLFIFGKAPTEIQIDNTNITFDERLTKNMTLFDESILLIGGSCSLRMGDPNQTFKFSSTGQVANGTNKGGYAIHAEIDNTFFACREICKDHLIDLQGQFNHIPTRLLQYGLTLLEEGTKLQLTEFIGEEFSADFKQIKKQNSHTIVFNFNSLAAQSRFELDMSESALQLKAPAQFLFQTPEQKMAPLNLTVHQLLLPFSQTQEHFRIQATFSGETAEHGGVKFHAIKGAIEKQLDQPLHFSINAILDADKNVLHGSSLTLFSTIEIPSSETLHFPNLTLQIEKKHLPLLHIQGDLHATLHQGIQLNLVSNAEIAPEWTELYIENFADYSLLRQPLQVRLSISKTLIPYNGFLAEQIYSQGGIEIQELKLKPTTEHTLEKLANLSARWSVDGSKNKASVRFKTYLHYLNENTTNKIRINTNIYHWHHQGIVSLVNSHLDSEAKFPNIPVGFFETLFQQPYLKELIGPQVRLNFKLNYRPNEQTDSQFEFAIASQAINAFGELKIGDQISLRDFDEPLILDWSITPQRLAILRRMFAGTEKLELRALELLNDSKVKISIEDLVFNKPKSLKELLPALTNGIMTLQFRLDPFVVNDPNQKIHTHFEKIFGEIVTKAHSENVAFTMKMKGASGLERKRFDSVFTGYFDEAFNANGSLATDRITLSLTSTHKRSPLSLICEFLFPTAIIGKSITPLIGEFVDGHVELKTKSIHDGTFSTNLSGDNGQFKVSGKINKEFLHFDQPLIASLKVTPLLGKSILHYLNPLLSSISKSEQMMKLTVQKEGLRIPLKSENIDQLNIPSIMLDIGKVHFHNTDSVTNLLEVLNYQTGNQSTVNIWLMPLYASIQEGLLNISRVDMLIDDTFPVAMWGKVDLIKDKLKLKLGLTPIALYRSHHIEIDKDTLFIFPIVGSSSKARIDIKKIAARMASKTLKSQGLEAQLPAFALDLITGNLKEDRAPKLTTDPLPWEINHKKSPSGDQSVLQNGAQKIINNIFK